MAGLYSWTGIKRQNIKPQCDRFIFPDGHGVIVLAEGRLLNLGWVQERKGGGTIPMRFAHMHLVAAGS